MGFKNWLIKESGASSAADDFFYGLQLYPSDAFDYAYASSSPTDVLFLQRRWKIETKQGRDMININYPEFIKRTFTSVKSKSAPGTESGFWNHKEDNNLGGDLEIFSHTHLHNLGTGKDAAHPTVLHKPNTPAIKVNLDKIFGDKSGDVPKISNNFDKPWTRMYENITPYDVIGPGQEGINAKMGPGVRSKYVCSDDVNPMDEKLKKIKIANFGFNKRNKKKYQKKC